MQPSQRIAAVLIFPAIAYLGAACERTDSPTGARPMASVVGPAPLLVDDDLIQCPTAQYTSIQVAVTAAAPGDHIDVCPGTYNEQVTIPAGKDNIRLRSTRRWGAIIKAPAVMALDPFVTPAYTIVRIAGAQNTTILAFTITGPGPGPCGSLHYGVRVHTGGSADILGNHITQIKDNVPSGCQNGVAILVGRWVDATTGSARIIGNVIDDYQKNGPTVDNTGSHAEIVNNRILSAPSGIIARNGIQVSRGATADIRHNFVSENVYTPSTDASTGILFYGSGLVLSDHNTLTANDVGVYMFTYMLFEGGPCVNAAGSVTAHNRVRASNSDGLIVSGFAPAFCSVTGVEAAQNKSDNNGGQGIGVYDADDDKVDDNFVENSGRSGILLDNADNSTIGHNQVRQNGTADGDLTDGIRVEASSKGNTLQSNHLRDNVTHDCHDNSIGLGTAGTANSWVNDHGETSLPPGLCGKDDDDADFETSTVYGWDAAYPWYDAFDIAAEFDWAAAYATIDTESLLRLVPAARTGGIRRSPPSPNQ